MSDPVWIVIHGHYTDEADVRGVYQSANAAECGIRADMVSILGAQEPDVYVGMRRDYVIVKSELVTDPAAA